MRSAYGCAGLKGSTLKLHIPVRLEHPFRLDPSTSPERSRTLDAGRKFHELWAGRRGLRQSDFAGRLPDSGARGR